MRVRKYVIGWLLAAMGGILCLGCGPQGASSEKDGWGGASSGNPSRPVPVVAGQGPATIRVASFNIQVFGQSKLEKPQVMDVLAQVARRYDVLAIQEVRSKEQDVLPRFVEWINSLDPSRASGRGPYDYVIGPRLGRTSSKEQYAYVYDTSRVELVPESVYTVADPQDLLHRPPLVASFRTRSGPSAFRFTLINVHTDPDETDTELDALDDVYLAVVRDGGGEDDVILLGDLNVSASRLGELGRVPDLTWTVDGEPTNTRQTQSYDNLLFQRYATSEFTGRSGILNLLTEFGLDLEQALEVSDHFPVWGEFSATESENAFVAARPRRQ